MKKQLLLSLSLVFALVACSDLQTLNSNKDGGDNDVFATGMIGSVKGANTSEKLSTKQSRANMEEIVQLAQTLGNSSLAFNLPNSFQKLGALTQAGRSELEYKELLGKLRNRLALCEVHTKTKPANTKYMMFNANDDREIARLEKARQERIEREREERERRGELPVQEILEPFTCDFDMIGNSDSSRIKHRPAARDITVSKKNFKLVRKSEASELNSFETIQVSTYSADGSEGFNRVGEAVRSRTSQTVDMKITMMNGQTFQVRAIYHSDRTDHKIADRKTKFESKQGFYGMVSIPGNKLSYEWEKFEGTDMKEIEEYTKVNGARILPNGLD